MFTVLSHPRNTDKNYIEILSHLSEWLSSRKHTTNAGEDADKNGTLIRVGGSVNWCSHYGSQYGGSSYNKEIGLPYSPAIPLLALNINAKESKSV
jgi:hypothetical protein